MRIVLLAAVATACLSVCEANATVYRVDFGGGSTFAISVPSAAGVTYSAPSGDGARTSGSFVFDTNDPATMLDGKGGKFYLGSTGSVTFSNLVNLPNSSYTFTSPRIVLDLSGMTVGAGISVSLAPGTAANTTDVFWIDTSHYGVRHTETNGGYELNQFSASVTSIAQVVAVPEPPSIGVLAAGLAATGLITIGGRRRRPV